MVSDALLLCLYILSLAVGRNKVVNLARNYRETSSGITGSCCFNTCIKSK